MNSMKKQYTDNSVKLFFVVVIIFSIIVEYLIINSDPSWLYLLLMWLPAISAIIANIVSIKQNNERLNIKDFISRLGIRSCKIVYILLSVIIPLVYLLIPYMFYWHKYPNDFAYNGVPINLILRDILLPIIIGTLVNVISAIGEEIGWRGFMFPALFERIGLKKTLIYSSLFWCLWHLPILVFGNYMTGTQLWYKIPAFILCITPVGIISGLLTYRSNSIWPATFLHAAHNNFDQAIFGLITRGDNMMYYVSETGILTIICAWIIAIILFTTTKNKQS